MLEKVPEIFGFSSCSCCGVGWGSWQDFLEHYENHVPSSVLDRATAGRAFVWAFRPDRSTRRRAEIERQLAPAIEAAEANGLATSIPENDVVQLVGCIFSATDH